ncbi:putative glycosyltransferase EpsF [Pelotomaculum schinkii]|uniref:Putative glycosyltransferase EpsF n=1 Tax=Pelotomaculum schinkii TaxID=78350 RepID=A0A4Y7RCN4_9FIRM|nr:MULTISPECIES: glycosyltransferase [Pelotomaculum]TEB06592.1 putative glycosyltransferase EpsF [Pelotomaculum schinkii]TEB17613.1 putative glycosyltransferase EpsF [Pelotomaculum sp. FP]
MTWKKGFKIKLLHLITDLHVGGAEMMLYKLLSNIDREVFEVEVVSLTDTGPVGIKIRELGVPVRALEIRKKAPNPLKLLQFARQIRQSPPHCIQTWMYHADLAGGLASVLAGRIPVIWGIRHSRLDPQSTKRTTLWIAGICARLSRKLPAKIVCCSEASRQVHAELGYETGKMVVIPNGFDLSAYKPDPSSRIYVRRELGIPEEALLIGMVARYAPDKDHRNFIYAAARLNTCRPDVHFLLCGDGVTWENPELVAWTKAAGILDRCHLLGRRDDIARLTASLDIATSSSYSEGFSNVIGEAMACGVPCVATDVGDSALVVGQTGKAVPPKDHRTLAQAWSELIELGPVGRSRLGQAARLRIKEHFSLPLIVNRYEELYKEVICNDVSEYAADQ